MDLLNASRQNGGSVGSDCYRRRGWRMHLTGRNHRSQPDAHTARLILYVFVITHVLWSLRSNVAQSEFCNYTVVADWFGHLHTSHARLNLSKRRKQLQRLAGLPKQLAWSELESTLIGLGFEKSDKSGSRVMFHDPTDPSRVIHLHRPHGRNPPTVLVVYVKEVVSRLEEWGYYDDE